MLRNPAARTSGVKTLEFARLFGTAEAVPSRHLRWNDFWFSARPAGAAGPLVRLEFRVASGYRESAFRSLSAFVEREDSLLGTKVTIFNNGPLRIEGDFEIVDQEGKAFGLGGRTGVSLCRCGHSSNSPFCNGTHKRQNFTNVVTARDLPAPAKP